MVSIASVIERKPAPAPPIAKLGGPCFLYFLDAHPVMRPQFQPATPINWPPFSAAALPPILIDELECDQRISDQPRGEPLYY